MNVHRYLRGDRQEILVPVRGKIVVEAGDLMYLNSTDSYYAQPFSYNVIATAGTAKEHALYTDFIGVAMEASLSGSTENIVVAAAGVFRYPISPGISAVTVGAVVSAASTPAASGASNQVVCNGVDRTYGSTAYLGYIVKTGTSASSFVDFQIRTKVGPGGLIAQ